MNILGRFSPFNTAKISMTDAVCAFLFLEVMVKNNMQMCYTPYSRGKYFLCGRGWRKISGLFPITRLVIGWEFGYGTPERRRGRRKSWNNIYPRKRGFVHIPKRRSPEVNRPRTFGLAKILPAKPLSRCPPRESPSLFHSTPRHHNIPFCHLEFFLLFYSPSFSSFGPYFSLFTKRPGEVPFLLELAGKTSSEDNVKSKVNIL